MLVEFSIMPLSGGASLSDEIARVLELVDASGVRYRLTPTGTILEGEWQPLMDLIRRCHEETRKGHSHVVTIIKIEDEAGATNKMETNISSVEERLGRSLQTS